MTGVCRYLAAHNYYSNSDVVDGQIVLTLQDIPERACVWNYVRSGGKYMLQQVDSFHPSGVENNGWYLAMRSDIMRDSISYYLTVTQIPAQAVNLIVVKEPFRFA